MCISRSISKCCFRGISELDYFGVNKRRKWAGRSEQSSNNGIEIGGAELVVPQDPYSQEEFIIYKRSFTFQSAVQVELAVAHPDSAKWAANFGKKAAKEEVLRNVSDNGLLKAGLKKFLSVACSARNKTVLDVMPQPLGY